MCAEAEHCTRILMHTNTWTVAYSSQAVFILFSFNFHIIRRGLLTQCKCHFLMNLMLISQANSLSPLSSLLFRDVGYGRRYFSGALEATVVGKRDTVLPCVHDWVWASGPDNTAHSPGACSCPTWAHASAAHLSYGKLWTTKKCGCIHRVRYECICGTANACRNRPL